VRRIRPSLVDAELEAAMGAFLSGLPYFIGPEGFPPMGRSLSYRTALPAPLIAGVHVDLADPALALRALDLVNRMPNQPEPVRTPPKLTRSRAFGVGLMLMCSR
jgi:hypothetical protein